MHYVDSLPILFTATIFVVFFGYLLVDSFWARRSNRDDGL